MDFDAVLAMVQAHADERKAQGMRAYMRDQFEFLGVATPVRRASTRPVLREARNDGRSRGNEAVDWLFIHKCWDCEYRELQYVAIDYLLAMVKWLDADDLDLIAEMAKVKPWWDTVDGLAGVVSRVVRAHRDFSEKMVTWSVDENMWVRRMAIEHQLGYKAETDEALLERIILDNVGGSEFFINKAIGWALRDYSKTNPAWVSAFIERHGDKLAALSIREGRKYV